MVTFGEIGTHSIIHSGVTKVGVLNLTGLRWSAPYNIWLKLTAQAITATEITHVAALPWRQVVPRKWCSRYQRAASRVPGGSGCGLLPRLRPTRTYVPGATLASDGVTQQGLLRFTEELCSSIPSRWLGWEPTYR